MISVKAEIVIRVKLTLKYWSEKNYCLQTGSYVLGAQVTKVKKTYIMPYLKEKMWSLLLMTHQ